MIFNAKSSNIKIASELFINGKIVIYPTDTLYGIGVDATNTIAINKLNKFKKRILPLSIIVGSLNMLKKYAKINELEFEKISKLLPGKFTLLLNEKKSNLSDKITLNTSKIGIRMPKSKFILDVVNYINKPIVTTSINLHGENPINDIDVISKFFDSFNIFKNGSNAKSKGSTILDFTNNNIKILRRGDGKIII